MPICCRLVVDKRKWGEIPVKVGSLHFYAPEFSQDTSYYKNTKVEKISSQNIGAKKKVDYAANFFDVHLGDEIMSNYREIASVKNSQICAMPICCRLQL